MIARTFRPRQATGLGVYQQRYQSLNPQQQGQFKSWLGAMANRGSHQVAPSNGAITPSAPSPLEMVGWQRQRQQFNNDYSNAIARLQAQQADEARQFDFNRGQLDTQYGQARQHIPYGALAHGMLHSGVYGGQLQDMYAHKMDSLRQLLMGHQSNMDQFGVQRGNFERMRASGLENVALAEALRRQQLAAQVLASQQAGA